MKTLDLTLLNENTSEAQISDFNIEEENKNCVEVYYYLVEAFKECEKFAEKYLNLVAIFFPQLMKIITGYILKNNEIKKSNLTNTDLQMFRALDNFPYIGYREILDQKIELDSKIYPSNKLALSKNKKMLSVLNKLFKKRKKIALIDHTSYGSYYIIKRILSLGLIPVFPSFVSVHIPNYHRQMDVLRTFILKIMVSFDLKIKASQISELFINFTSPFLSNKYEPLGLDVLLTGTLQKLKTRIIAAKARFQNIPVITLSHGEGDQLIIDEPRIGYGELTFPTVFIGYGENGKYSIQNSKFLKGLYDPPVYVASNSYICKKIYNHSKKIRKLSCIDNPQYMYVPNSFHSYLIYGPFHSMPDTVYFEWQKVICRLFPTAIYKKHPKLFKVKVPFNKIEEVNFSKCLEMTDVFIFDYIATAFNIAAASDKPIIYFDIGIRNIHSHVISLLKGRCIWIDARQNKTPEYLNLEIEKQRNKELINDYTEKYCIINSDIKREDTIISTIESILK